MSTSLERSLSLSLSEERRAVRCVKYAGTLLSQLQFYEVDGLYKLKYKKWNEIKHEIK